MKNLRHFCASITLVFVLSLSALAGEIDLPGITAPPPPVTSSSTTAEQINLTGATTNTTASGQNAGALSLEQALILLLQSALVTF